MKTFLLLVLAFALVMAPMVMAYPPITGGAITCSISEPCTSPQYCDNGVCVPEFTTIGAGIAVAGAGVAYSLIRKKK